MKRSPFPLWGIVMGGPTLCGGVAVFSNRYIAEFHAKASNDFNMRSPYAEKDADGISKAWKMGDGKCWVVEITAEDQLEQFFVWE